MSEPLQYQPSKLSRKQPIAAFSSPINPAFRKDPDQDPWNDYVPDELLIQNSENLDPTTISSFSRSTSNQRIKAQSTQNIPFQAIENTHELGQSINKRKENGISMQQSKKQQKSLSRDSTSQNIINQQITVNEKPVSFQKAYKKLAQQMLDRQLNETDSQPPNLIEGLLLGPKQIEHLEVQGEMQERAKMEAFRQKLCHQTEKANQKREALVTEVINHQLKDCTFSPQVTSLQGQDPRSFSEFLNDQQNFQSRLEAKKKALKEAEELRLESKQRQNPTINENSRRLIEMKTPQNNKPLVFDRLYSQSTRSHSQNVLNSGNNNSQFFPEDPNARLFNGLSEVPEISPSTTNRPFVPEINPKSRQISRNEPIEQILYRDAQRRKNGVPLKEPKKSNVNTVSQQQTLRNPVSDRLLIQRFIKDFEAATTMVTKEPGKDLSDYLDYLSLNEVLKSLCFVSGTDYSSQENQGSGTNIQGVLAQERALLSELWTILRGEMNNGVSKRNLCVFLLAVQGLFWSEVGVDRKREGEQSQNEGVGSFNEKGEWEIDESECRLIHATFELFYRTRLANESLRKSKKAVENSRFQPEISETSKVLAEHYRERLLEEFANIINTQTIPELKVPENGALTHTDLLVLQKKTQVLQHERKKQEKRMEELKECPFKPNIKNGNARIKPAANQKNSKPRFLELYDLAKTKANKKDRNSEEIEYEKNMEHCTFKPEIIAQKKPPIEKSPEYFARDIEKTVERMRNARKERQLVKLWTERGIVLKEQLISNEDPAANVEKFRGISSSSRITRLEDELASNENQMIGGNKHEEISHEHQDYKENELEIENSLENNRIPLLYVDVNLGANRTERIVVFEGDESEELAERFVQEHGLDSNMKFKLKDLLDAQIAGVLTRIEEERASLNSDSEFNHQMH